VAKPRIGHKALNKYGVIEEERSVFWKVKSIGHCDKKISYKHASNFILTHISTWRRS